MTIAMIRQRATVQEEKIAANATASNWETTGLIWMSLEPIRHHDIFADNMLGQTRATHAAIFRAAQTIPVRTGHRLIANGKTYDILTIANLDARGRWKRAVLIER